MFDLRAILDNPQPADKRKTEWAWILLIVLAGAGALGEHTRIIVLTLFAFVVFLVIYFLPSMYAVHRKLDRGTVGYIFAVNLLTGWLIIPWLLCFIWAAAVARQLPQ